MQAFYTEAIRISKQNVEVVHRAVETWNSASWDFALDLLDPDVEIHSPLSSVRGEPYLGVEGFREWIADVFDQFEVWETRLDEIRPVSEDRLLVLGSVHARGRGSGVELDWTTAMLVDFREGRVLRLTIYADRAEALKVVGLEG